MGKINFNEIINRKGTYSTQWDYIKDRFGRDDILPFSISDTDFRAPKEIIEAVRELVDFGIYGYTRWNHDDFVNSIKNHYKNYYGDDISDTYVAYSPSVLFSIAILFEVLSKTNDSVVTFNPMYDAFFKVVENNNRNLTKVDLNFDNGEFSFDEEELEHKIMNSQILLLCSPHNPTGKVWTPDEISYMINLCEKHDVWIIADEIHADMVHDTNFTSLFGTTSSYEKLVVVSSASKTFNTPSLGGSYAIFKSMQTQQDFIELLRNKYFVNSASLPGIKSLMVGYDECDYYIEELKAYIYDNYLYAKERLESINSKIKVTNLHSTYLMWIKIDELCDTNTLSENLINYGKVGIMSGSVYGDSRFLRLNIGCPRAKLEEGLNRVEKTLEYMGLLDK